MSCYCALTALVSNIAPPPPPLQILQLKHSNRSLNNQVQIHQILTPRVSVGSASEEENLRLRIEEEAAAGPGRPGSGGSGSGSGSGSVAAQQLGVAS